MSYKITEYTKNQARKLNVYVFPAKNPKKKLDIYDKDCNYITSVGASGYMDYPNYLKAEKKGIVPKGTAEKKRKSYKARHVYRNRKNSPAYFADKLLW